MGSMIELNDTLEITTAQGFPADLLNLARHREKPLTIDAVRDKVFAFRDKPNARIYQLDPVRVFYVHNIDGKWLFWGHVYIQTQTISKNADGAWITAGTYKIVSLYDPVFQEQFTRREAPPGKGYFDDSAAC